jgi:two-component system chemotaxis response regulator CheB
MERQTHCGHFVSGYDGDGAAALCGIKKAGGITIAQKLETAAQPDMGESAISTGCIDFVLSPEDIAQEVVRIAPRRLAKAKRHLTPPS